MTNRLLIFVALVMCGVTSVSAQEQRNITLSTPTGDIQGSLLMPSGDSVNTVALIVAGSGPTDRDGNQIMMRNNSLRMLAISLAANNIASVRFDKRGIGASRMANFDESEVLLDTYVDDVKRWVAQLRRDGRFQKVVIVGHSEGALIGMAAVAQGCKVSGLVSVAGMGRTFDQVLKDQLSNQPAEIRDIAYSIVDSLAGGHMVKRVPFFLVSTFSASVQPFIISMMQYNPQQLIRQLGGPVLLVQGDADIQIKVEDARLLWAANPKAHLKVIAGMNHVLKDCPSQERNMQIATYVNPALPINKQLVYEIVKFITHL